MPSFIRPLFFLLPLAAASYFRAPAPRLSAAAPSTKQLYSQIDAVLRRNQKEGGQPLSVSTARALGKQWMDMPPADLVEATLVSGAVLLDSFDEGLAILLEAEEVADLAVSGKAYSALMRLAHTEERDEDVLRLMARTRAVGVMTDGQLLGAMNAAATLGDWGAVARLYAELSEGAEAAAASALELETFSDPQVLDELRAAGAASRAKSSLPPTECEYALALTLALQAHCERGDVSRVTPLLERKRQQGDCLSSDEYKMLLALAKRLQSPAPLLALRPIDLKRSLDAELEPRTFAVTNKIGMAAAALGTVERRIVAGVGLAALVATAAALSGAVDGVGDAVTNDPFANM